MNSNCIVQYFMEAESVVSSNIELPPCESKWYHIPDSCYQISNHCLMNEHCVILHHIAALSLVSSKHRIVALGT